MMVDLFRFSKLVGVLVCTGLLASCDPGAQKEGDVASPSGKAETPNFAAIPPWERQVYFGDLHVHTNVSVDSAIRGNANTPRDAYRFARGEAITTTSGATTQLTRALDFAAVTDHSEGFDVYALCNPANGTFANHEICVGMAQKNPKAFARVFKLLAVRPPQRDPILCADPAVCESAREATWQMFQDVAEEFNEPGVFTSFHAYEYSPTLAYGGMLHRNIIFRNAQVPDRATSVLDAPTAVGLWTQLEHDCVAPCEVIAIPHNSNLSWGLTFDVVNIDGQPLTQADFAQRARMEPLVEIFQAKGASECLPGTSDEQCDFEAIFPQCEEGSDRVGCSSPTSFVREGLKQGLAMEEQTGLNPFQMGFIGSTDTHNGNPGGTEEFQYIGHAGLRDDTPTKRLNSPKAKMNGRAAKDYNPGGLAAIWAEGNNRDALFDGLKRRETYATSGTRIGLRFFGAWTFAPEADEADDLLEVAYADGVPMGGTLTNAPTDVTPKFVAIAQRAPYGTPLEKIQMIKGWLEDGEPREKVYDIACSFHQAPDPLTGQCPDNGAWVNLEDCSFPEGKGDLQIDVTWEDPDFDPSQRAFYYVRVLENPSCRWSTIDAIHNGLPMSDKVPATIQERAWSSPIWYKPE